MLEEQKKTVTPRFTRLLETLEQMAQSEDDQIRKWSDSVLGSQEFLDLQEQAEHEKFKMNRFAEKIIDKIRDLELTQTAFKMNPQVKMGKDHASNLENWCCI